MRKMLLVLTALTAVSAFSACTGSNNLVPTDELSCMGFPEISSDLPFDVDLPNHENVQCFAWQEFIALSWPAGAGGAGVPDGSVTPALWGDPGMTSPTVWETFKEAHEVFLPDGSRPDAWGVSRLMRSFEAPQRLSLEAGLTASELSTEELAGARILANSDQSDGLRVLRMTSKVSDRLHGEANQLAARSLSGDDLDSTEQAFGGHLTGQNRRLTYYAIHVNRPLFDYIVANGLYDANRQAGQLIRAPRGSTGLGSAAAQEGAVVLKSAWLDLTGVPADRRRRFHTADVCLLEAGGFCRHATVGLVGLHIVHKTETFPQWSWATFEHVDNAPDREDVRQSDFSPPYNYYDPACPASDPRCQPNVKPGPASDRTQPTPVVRVTPLERSVNELNDQVHRMIRAANPDSVWQHYRLIDVQWPEAGQAITSIQNVPLPAGGPRPTILANATLETYVQRKSCLDCHQNAAIATGSQAADYGFLYGLAQPGSP